MQDEYTVQTGSTKTLGCTAGDVKIAKAQNPRALDGTPITQCVQDSTFSFIADFFVQTTSTSSRSNIGLYLNTKDETGGALAVGDTCVDNIISPVHAPGSNITPADNGPACYSGPGQTPQCLGSSSYGELDAQTNPKGQATPDNCGDGSAGSTQLVTIEVDQVKCEPGAGGQLVLPNCTSWQIPGGTIQCETGPDSSALTGWLYSTAAVPGTTSKCSCNSTFTVPIQVITGGLTVSKTASPTSITGTDGGTSTYTVTVTNSNNAGSDTVNSICDNVYGPIAGTGCSGTTTATNISCTSGGSAITFPYTLANPKDSLTCTFGGFVPEDSSVTDTVTASGVVTATNVPVSGTASATVTAGDAPASAAVIKTLGSASATSGCATVTYNVEVDNTSGATTDENEKLTGLSDNVYGDVTTTHGDAATNGSVTGTTCKTGSTIVANGKCSVSNASCTKNADCGASGGTCSGAYTCSFNGVMCGTFGSIGGTSCTSGLQVRDTVSATLTGDETGDTVSMTPGSLTASVCFTASGS